MSRFPRYLRIGTTAACGIVCLALLFLWLRSYWFESDVKAFVTPTNRYELHSRTGKLIALKRRRLFISVELTLAYPETFFDELTTRNKFGVSRYSSDYFSAVGIPYWLLTVAAFFLAFVPWMRWRYSLRSLLAIITLVALILGYATLVNR
jgi:hypothetical protein